MPDEIQPDRGGQPVRVETTQAEPAGVSNSDTISEIRGVALVPQPNGSKLLAGGLPGNRGGPGAPPSAIREQLRGSFAERIKVLEEIADNDKYKPRDRAQAIEILARYGLGTLTEVSVDTVREKVRLTLEAIRVHCDAELASRLIVALRPIWADK